METLSSSGRRGRRHARRTSQGNFEPSTRLWREAGVHIKAVADLLGARVLRQDAARNPAETSYSEPMPPTCPRCRSVGTYPVEDTKKAGGQRWECAECGKRFFNAPTACPK